VAANEHPYALWHQMLSAWETSVNNLGNQSMAAEEFSQVVHKTAQATHGAREAFETAMQRYLRAVSLPSRQEIEAISERLHGIEAQLGRLSQLVEGIAGKTGVSVAGAAAPKPRRTRMPPQGGLGSE
jgi:hypothetical protein